jgi:hypothetical protein
VVKVNDKRDTQSFAQGHVLLIEIHHFCPEGKTCVRKPMSS